VALSSMHSRCVSGGSGPATVIGQWLAPKRRLKSGTRSVAGCRNTAQLAKPGGARKNYVWSSAVDRTARKTSPAGAAQVIPARKRRAKSEI